MDVKDEEVAEFPSLLPDAAADGKDAGSGLAQAPVIEIIDGNKYQAYKEKMKLFGIFCGLFLATLAALLPHALRALRGVLLRTSL